MLTLDQCVLGWWEGSVGQTCRSAYCGPTGTDVPECQQADCREFGFMKLTPGGSQLQGTFAFSATSKTLSAPRNSELTWGLTSEGKIFLASNPNQPQSLTCDPTMLIIAGVSGWRRPPAGIISALQRGADTNQWISIPAP